MVFFFSTVTVLFVVVLCGCNQQSVIVLLYNCPYIWHTAVPEFDSIPVEDSMHLCTCGECVVQDVKELFSSMLVAMLVLKKGLNDVNFLVLFLCSFVGSVLCALVVGYSRCFLELLDKGI